MKLVNTLLLLPAFLLVALTHAQAQAISEKNIRKHIGYLASDKMQGRGTGSPEDLLTAKYIAKYFKKYGLQPKGNNGYFFDFTFKKSADPHGIDMTNAVSISSRDVVGYLDNGAPYTVVIGAHYDHLGLGNDGNSLDANPKGKIHNGADDNASGTSGILELARYYATNGVKENHNFLFLCFSAEELGLVGSKRFTENPTIDLNTVSYMLNMDMIGRLNEEKRIMAGGVGTAPDFVPALELLKGGINIKPDSAGIGPSDHTSFYLKNVPVLFFFTGQHADYHKPSDDADKINYPGEVEVLQLAVRVIDHLDKTPKLKFQETKNKQENTPRFKVTLGIMPNYTFDGEGVQVDGVTDGKPAAKAGVQKGDIIIGLGTLEIKGMQDYMKGLSMFKQGDATTVKVKRGNETVELPVTFQ